MNIGILGATGAVGIQMLQCLSERNIKVDNLKLLASEKSAGKILKFKGEDIVVDKTDENSFKNLDVVLGAVQNPFAKKYAPFIVDAGAVFIDNSSAFRMDEDIPLVVPQINKEDIKKNKGIIANPNCSTIITMVALNPINKLSEIKTIVATTFQAVSGAGVGGINELDCELRQILDEVDFKKTSGISDNKVEHNTFKHQIAFNVLPCIGNPTDNLYTTEEMKMQNEGRKIFHLPNLKVSCTCVRVPVMRSHSISVLAITKDNLSLEQIRKAIEEDTYLVLKDDTKENIYPMPLNTTNKDFVEVGRIRKDLAFDNAYSLFVSGDQIRKGAATNAVEILECL